MATKYIDLDIYDVSNIFSILHDNFFEMKEDLESRGMDYIYKFYTDDFYGGYELNDGDRSFNFRPLYLTDNHSFLISDAYFPSFLQSFDVGDILFGVVETEAFEKIESFLCVYFIGGTDTSKYSCFVLAAKYDQYPELINYFKKRRFIINVPYKSKTIEDPSDWTKYAKCSVFDIKSKLKNNQALKGNEITCDLTFPYPSEETYLQKITHIVTMLGTADEITDVDQMYQYMYPKFGIYYDTNTEDIYFIYEAEDIFQLYYAVNNPRERNEQKRLIALVEDPERNTYNAQNLLKILKDQPTIVTHAYKGQLYTVY